MSAIVYFDQSNNTTYTSVDDVRITYPTLPEAPTDADLESVRIVKIEAPEPQPITSSFGELGLHTPLAMPGAL